jgi:hypothetical protein
MFSVADPGVYPGSGFFHSGFWIWIFPSRIRDPHHRIEKNLKFLTQIFTQLSEL